MNEIKRVSSNTVNATQLVQIHNILFRLQFLNSLCCIEYVRPILIIIPWEQPPLSLTSKASIM